MAADFNLEYNDSIIARVQAVNAAGLKGEWRESDGAAKLKTKPMKLEQAPVRGQSTDATNLHVKWDKMVSGSDVTGGSEIIYYSVYDAANPDNALYSTMETFYLYEQVAAETSMSFLVSATNIYGEGEKSDASVAIVFGEVPDKVENLTSSNVDGLNEKATIGWSDPADLTISEIKIQVLNLTTSAYEDATIENADYLTVFGAELSCAKLTESFGYQAGDQIRFRVNAINTFG